jgi:alpha-tubulin suppressor-like RCC1 family protein
MKRKYLIYTWFIEKFSTISAATIHSLAIDATGQVWGWGSNLDGRLGDNTETHRCTPVAVCQPF